MSDVTLRPATEGDCERVYAFNCSPRARAWSMDPRAIPYSAHEQWFARRLADTAAPMWIVEEDAVPVGVVRIDNGRISIALGEGTWGRGIGRRAVALACRCWGQAVTAEIHESNTASHSCFAASGFSRVGANGPFHLYRWSP